MLNQDAFAPDPNADAAEPDAPAVPAAPDANKVYAPLVGGGPDGTADAAGQAEAAAQAGVSSKRLVVTRGRFIQVQRLANPLVNEVIIGTEDKDIWNALDPHQERSFLDYYLNPRFALALQTVFGVPAGTANRTDLVNLLLKYSPNDRRYSELLRLDVSVPPTPLADQKRMGPLATPPDPAAWPNGRRPKDDVTDIATRVVGGPNYIAALAGDGVNVDDAPLSDTFPFLAAPEDGRDRFHENP
jgi:hypothetical protein